MTVNTYNKMLGISAGRGKIAIRYVLVGEQMLADCGMLKTYFGDVRDCITIHDQVSRRSVGKFTDVEVLKSIDVSPNPLSNNCRIIIDNLAKLQKKMIKEATLRAKVAGTSLG